MPQRSSPLFEMLESRRLMSAVTGLSLMNADSDQAITSLTNGAVINLATLPTKRLNIKAALDYTPGSVRFNYDGNAGYKIENEAPYAIAGDDHGNLASWTPAVGTHTLVVTPYGSKNAAGTAGGAKSVTFTVMDSTPASTTFAHVYTVGPTGQYRTIGDAAAVAGPGDQVLIAAGTYRESLSLSRSGTSTAPITFTAATPGSVIIDGTGRKNVIKSNGGQHITMDGLVVSGVDNGASGDPAAVTTGTGWNLRNMTVKNNDGVGVNVYGSNVKLYNIVAEYNGRQGISGSDCSYVTVQNCTTRYNNTWNNDPDWDGGAGKWARADHITIDNMTSHNNVGVGIWIDYECSDIVIKNSRSYDNRGLAHAWSGNGIRVEVSGGPILIQNNSVWGNTGAQIDIQSTRNVTVTGNTITGTNLALKDWPRETRFAMYNVSITNNRFINSGILTEGGTWNSTSKAAKALTIDRNTYQGSLKYSWNYAAYYTTLADVRSKLGFELNGTTA